MMVRMLQQDAYIIRRSALFWLICAATLLLCALPRLDTDSELPVAAGLGIAYAFYAGAYIGDLGASGRLDNQVICGCPRATIWLSTWLTLTISYLVILLCALAGNLAAGLLRTTLHDSLSGWFVCILGFVLNAAAYAALYALIGLMLAGRRTGRGTTILIVMICVYLAIAVWESYVDSALSEPEYVPIYDLPPGVAISVDDMDSLYITDMVPNADYVPEPQRSSLESLLRFLPVSQSLWLTSFLYDELAGETIWMVLETYFYSIALTTACTVCGLLLFRRRELD